jgi:hypothetical protein
MVLMSSCATIMNTNTTATTIVVGDGEKVVYKDDTLASANGKIRIEVPRAAEPLELKIVSSGKSIALNIPSQYSTFYWLNITSNYGLGMLLDRRTKKRFTYPNYIYPDSTRRLGYAKLGPKDRRGELLLHMSYPHINAFFISPQETKKVSSGGFLGIALGAEYYYAPARFVALKGFGILDFFLPFPAPVKWEGSHQTIGVVGVELSHHHRFGRIAVGYGFLYQHYSWDRTTVLTEDYNGPYIQERSSYPAYGFSSSFYWQATRNFHMGVVYRPTYYRPGRAEELVYEHTLSIDFAWKFLLVGKN